MDPGSEAGVTVGGAGVTKGNAAGWLIAACRRGRAGTRHRAKEKVSISFPSMRAIVRRP